MFGIGETICCEYMVQIGVHGVEAGSEPCLWKRVLAVVAIALLGICSTLTASGREIKRLRPRGIVGIHIPDHIRGIGVISFDVGGIEGIPYAGAVREFGSIGRNDVEKGGFQVGTGQSGSGIIISGGNSIHPGGTFRGFHLGYRQPYTLQKKEEQLEQT